jgi:hypothetical protein
MRTVKLFLVIITLTSIIGACKKEPKRVSSSGSGITPGVIKGVIKLYDECNTPIKSMEGVEVSLVGTSNSVVTLADGKYQLTAPTGTYNIKYSKKGFGHYIGQVLVTGNGTFSPDPVSLYQLSSGAVNTLIYNDYDSTSGCYNFTVTLKSIPSASKQIDLVIPFSATPGVNATDPSTKIQYDGYLIWNLVNFSTMIGKISIPKSEFRDYSKQHVYIRAFVTIQGAGKIMDQETGIKYFGNFTDVSPEINFKTF